MALTHAVCPTHALTHTCCTLLADASECPPTYGASFDDVRGFVQGGWATMVEGANADPATRAMASGTEEGSAAGGDAPTAEESGPGLGPASLLMPLSWAWFERHTLPSLTEGDLALFVLPAGIVADREWGPVLSAATAKACTRLSKRVAATGCGMAVLRVGTVGEGVRLGQAFAPAVDARCTHRARIGVPVPVHSDGGLAGDGWWAQAVTAFACKLCLNTVSTGACLCQCPCQCLCHCMRLPLCDRSLSCHAPVRLALPAGAGAHIRKGTVFRNRMINLQVTNAKLFRRAVALVASLAACDEASGARAVQAGPLAHPPHTHTDAFPSASPAYTRT